MTGQTYNFPLPLLLNIMEHCLLFVFVQISSKLHAKKTLFSLLIISLNSLSQCGVAIMRSCGNGA